MEKCVVLLPGHVEWIHFICPGSKGSSDDNSANSLSLTFKKSTPRIVLRPKALVSKCSK